MKDVTLEKFHKLAVLIVDDSAAMRKLIRSLIDSFSVKEVFEAEDGTSAYKKILENQIDLVITDWKMEPMNGIDLTRKLRTEPDSPNPQIPIILISAHTDKDLIMAARDVGVNEVLTKPVSPALLKSRMTAILDRPRDFIKTETYAGPDRRRLRFNDYDGPDRRGKSDT